MSYDRPYRGRGGGRNRGRGGGGGGGDERWDHNGYESFETNEGRLRNAILRFGEADPYQEVIRLVEEIKNATGVPPPALAEGFRIGVTEQPYKIPFYAAVLRHLYEPTGVEETPPVGRMILEEFAKGFRAFLDKLAWRETRLCIHFFAHLTVAGVITTSSMSALIQSFIAVLDEFGVSHGRAKQAALCAVEGLMRAGPVLVHEPSSTNIDEMIGSIQTYIDSMEPSRGIVSPIVKLYTDNTPIEMADEILDAALNALRSMSANDFIETDDSYPQPSSLSRLDESLSPFELPSILVPPDVIELELDGLAVGDDGGDGAPPAKKEEWPEFYVRLFENDVTPNPSTPAGYAVRSALLDIIDIFEVNRKECARILMEYPRWTPFGTFRPRPGSSSEAEPVKDKDWQLESTIIETILGAAFLLPETGKGHKSLYYSALITELCKLSPSTVGPAVGKSIRRLYSAFQEGLDVDISRRFAEWFAIHMSNFGFQWVWKEWIPDLSLSLQHPKRVFIRRAIDFEIRLAYFDRVTKTLPEPFHDKDAHCLPEQAPGPNFDFEDQANPYHETAQSILDDLRSRAKVEDVMDHLESLRNGLIESSDELTNVDAVIRRIAVQSLLHVGSRSFSHFLNAIERYLLLLRNLSAGTIASDAPGPGSGECKTDILSAAASFWKYNPQMIAIVFDKLMQYQIVDPTDVVTWTFGYRERARAESGAIQPRGIGAEEWDLLKGALDKANGRVVIARKRLAAIRKEEDEKRARDKAVVEMDVDAPDTKQEDEVQVEDSPALVTATKAFSSLTREQRAALSAALEAFVLALTDATANPAAAEVITEKAWHNRINWGEDEWSAWETWAWYRHFCRLYSPYLRTYSNTLSTVSFARLEGSTSPAASLLKNIWSVALLEA